MPGYDVAARFPSRVWKAVEITRASGFALACIPEVGLLLRLFAGLHGVEKACELGTALGVGAAWIESGLRPEARLLTVELDPARAAEAQALFAGSRSVDVLAGDWSLAQDLAPFDLLFSDDGPKRAVGDPEKLAPLVRPGGLLVLDDYTPDTAGNDDDSRRLWLDHPMYTSQEIMVTPHDSVILAIRTGQDASTCWPRSAPRISIGARARLKV